MGTQIISRVSHSSELKGKNRDFSGVVYFRRPRFKSFFFHKSKMPFTYTSTAYYPAQQFIYKNCSNRSSTNT